MTEPIHILSLGAGVQSSTLALMAAAGEVTPMPKAAIFADTQAEPASVYRWLDWLEGQLPFPVRRVTAGDLTETSTRLRVSGRTGNNYLSHLVPAFTVMPGGAKGTWFRQCTDKHKLTPLRQAIDAERSESAAIVWIGISTDEAIRMKQSKRAGVTHIWPLIDAGMSRADCLRWMGSHGFPTPPRSSCSFCPYHSDKEWLRLKTQEPEAWIAALAYERRMQEAAARVPRLNAVPFLHSSLVPLAEVALTDADRGQGDLFGEDCTGMCGV